MPDFVQIIILVVLVLFTVLFIVLGIQVFYILKELRQTINKANKVLETTNSITESVSRPLSSLASLATGLQAGSLITVIKFVKGLLSKEDRTEKKQTKE